MKIAQIAPLAESVPPKLYGGTERIVSYITEELVHQGHDVTLFASGDSVTSAKLVPVTKMALRLNPHVKDPIPHHMILLDEVRRRADEFDILHFHIDLLHMPMVQDMLDRTVTTLHGRLDLPDLVPEVVARVVGGAVGAGAAAGTLARAAYDGVPGHPVLLGRDHWAGVAAAATGDRGARDYLAAADVVLVECGDLATGHDVDAPR